MSLSVASVQENNIECEKTINFIDGIPGFEEYKKFVIVNNADEKNPFHRLQSVEDEELSFIIINPFIFKHDYEFDLPDWFIKKLEIESEQDLAIYTIVVVPGDITKMTANLLGPIIINTKNMTGKQIVLDDKRYTTKYLIIDEQKNRQEL